MSSFYIFYIFAAAFVLVQCQEYNHVEPDEFHQHFDLDGGCDKETKMQIMANRKAVARNARERHVLLKPVEGYEYSPNAVSVKRCNGYCPGRWSPMPTETLPKQFRVQLHRRGDRRPLKCVSIEVLEHVNCICKCMRTKDYCNKQQRWDAPNCACQCIGRDIKKRECEAKHGMVWDDDDCSCRCVGRIMDCRNGQKWDMNTCSCVPDKN